MGSYHSRNEWQAVVLAAVGLGVAGYLAACQLGLATAWDPLFGSDASQRVLHSWLSKELPVPDAALGAAGYAFELCLALTLLRWRPGGRLNAWARVAYGAAAVGMALAGAFLVGVQALSLHAFCTLWRGEGRSVDSDNGCLPSSTSRNTETNRASWK
jgi:uncharacterized membrane protein